MQMVEEPLVLLVKSLPLRTDPCTIPARWRTPIVNSMEQSMAASRGRLSTCRRSPCCLQSRGARVRSTAVTHCAGLPPSAFVTGSRSILWSKREAVDFTGTLPQRADNLKASAPATRGRCYIIQRGER